jgi:hypothetical protein
MAGKSRSLGRLPIDGEARERLRTAQVAEGTATGAVYDAQAAVEAAIGKRDQAVAAASVAVQAAETALASKYAELISVSGADRAAVLLGMTRTALKRLAKNGTTDASKPT